MSSTVKKVGVKAGLVKLKQNKWRQITAWFSTSTTDDVEIVQGYIVQLGAEVGVIEKSSERLQDCLEIIQQEKKTFPSLQQKLRVVISHNCKYATQEVLMNAVQTATKANLGVPLLVYVKGVKVKVDEHTEMKKEIGSLNKAATITTDRRVVLNYVCRATLLTFGDEFESRQLESFVWNQGVSVLSADERQVSDLLKNQANYYCGKSQLFRALVFAKNPNFQIVLSEIRAYSPFTPILTYVSSKISEQPTLTFKTFPNHTAEACVSTEILAKSRIKISSNQQDLLFFGLMRPLHWAPDLQVGSVVTPSPQRPPALVLKSSETSKPPKPTGPPPASDGFLIFQTIVCNNITPREKKDLADPYILIVSDTLELPSVVSPPSSARLSKKHTQSAPEFKKIKTEPQHKTLDPKWDHLDKDEKYKFSCHYGSTFSIEVCDSKDKASHGVVNFTVKDLLSQMPLDDCQLEVTFALKEIVLLRHSSSPRFPLSSRGKHSGVTGTITFVVKWALLEDAVEPTKALKHFGVPLATSLLTAKKAGHEHIAIKMMRFIEKNGIQTLGIFRINASHQAIREMTATVEKGDVLQLDSYKVNDIAGFLKKYFKEMPQCLLPEELFPQLKTIEAIKDCQDWEDVEKFQQIYNKMPLENRVIMKNLIKCLADVAYWCDVNKMTAENLATVWAPNIFIPKSITDPTQFLQVSKFANNALTFVIEWAYDIFNFSKFENLWPDEEEDNLQDYDEEIPETFIQTTGRQRPLENQ